MMRMERAKTERKRREKKKLRRENLSVKKKLYKSFILYPYYQVIIYIYFLFA